MTISAIGWPAGWTRQRRSQATIVTASLSLLVALWVAASFIALAPAPIGPNAKFFAEGMVVTVELTIVAGLVGVALGLLAALGKTSRLLPLRWLSGFYIWVIRGTPLLVQLFLVYYGLAQFDAVKQSVLWPWLGSAWFCAIAAFSVNTCAYTIEILHGAMRAVPAGEIEAARAMGMSRGVLLRRVVLPAAFRRMLPAYGNEAILMLQATSLASTVTLMDITGAARTMNSTYYLPFEAFLTAAALYLVLTTMLVGLFHAAERRWLMPWQTRMSR